MQMLNGLIDLILLMIVTRLGFWKGLLEGVERWRGSERVLVTVRGKILEGFLNGIVLGRDSGGMAWERPEGLEVWRWSSWFRAWKLEFICYWGMLYLYVFYKTRTKSINN